MPLYLFAEIITASVYIVNRCACRPAEASESGPLGDRPPIPTPLVLKTHIATLEVTTTVVSMKRKHYMAVRVIINMRRSRSVTAISGGGHEDAPGPPLRAEGVMPLT